MKSRALINKPGGVWRTAAGFTMMEMLMALAIFSIAFGTIYKTFDHLNRSTATENVKAGTQQAVRIAVDFMVQDIRLAGLNPLGSPGIGIQAISPGSIRFTMDANFDGDAEDTFEDITYAFNGANGTLTQTNHLGDEVLIDNITDLNFTYLDSEDQTTSDLDDIRSVVVSLTMQRPAGRDEQVSRTYTTRVRCRNL
jgi:type IV pilus assembly protein PilW